MILSLLLRFIKLCVNGSGFGLPSPPSHLLVVEVVFIHLQIVLQLLDLCNEMLHMSLVSKRAGTTGVVRQGAFQCTSKVLMDTNGGSILVSGAD